MIDLTGTRTPGKGMLVEEGAIPGALRALMPAAFAVAADIDDGGSPLAFARAAAAPGPGHRRARRSTRTGGPADRSLTYLVMSDDAGDGRAVPRRRRAAGRLARGRRPADLRPQRRRCCARPAPPLGGEYVANPLWSPMLHESLVTVHPLGGCAMADDGAHGVVDDRGRVFTGEGDDVHDGLLVADGAIVPRPLAVNPLLTISALSERAAALLAAERGWHVAGGPTPRLRPAPAGGRTGPACASPSAWPGWAGPGDRRRPASRGVRPRGEADGTPHRVRAHHRRSTTCRPCWPTPPRRAG